MKDKAVVNHIKGLVIDGVHAAKSGHPGGAMSSADFATLLFTEFLRFDPADASWLNRDRFVLSAGHESMLLYALLYASDWMDLDQLKKFRQLQSQTPGHPEYGLSKGVECTTGPLGQGAAMAVGFAIAASHLRAQFGETLFNSRTWALLGDGCIQEGVTLGAASLAGHLKLNNLIWYYDKNFKQISGDISRVTSDDHTQIFKGFGWAVREVDGHDENQLREAMRWACDQPVPALIIGKSVMGHGCASMEGSHKTHGSPLPPDERTATKKALGLDPERDFQFPAEIKAEFQQNFQARRDTAKKWQDQLAQKNSQDPNFSSQFDKFFSQKIELSPISWPDSPMATRNAFGRCLEEWHESLPNLLGGSADLEPSNMTGGFAKAVGDFSYDNPQGRNIAFGVREFPMSAICNGIALYGGFIAFDATFLSFADYSRPALRLGALQGCPVIHEFSHDSFYLGEDGPTHQPVEQLMSLRAMPGLDVYRPADAAETEQVFRLALTRRRPACLLASRQKLPPLAVRKEDYTQVKRGAWRVFGTSDPELVFFASGSEVHLAIEAASELKSKYKVAVVNVCCWEVFFEQDLEYQKSMLLPGARHRVSIEAGVTLGWERFVGREGLTIGLNHFGDSAPMADLAEKYGFTKDQVVAEVRKAFSL